MKTNKDLFHKISERPLNFSIEGYMKGNEGCFVQFDPNRLITGSGQIIIVRQLPDGSLKLEEAPESKHISLAWKIKQMIEAIRKKHCE